MLHFNTSILEALFSLMRSMGGRDAESYESRIGCVQAKAMTQTLAKSNSYGLAEHMDEDGAGSNSGHDQAKTRELNSEIESHRNGWLARFGAELPEGGTVSTEIFSPALQPHEILGRGGDGRSQEILKTLFQTAHLNGHFSAAQAVALSIYFVLSKYTQREGIFESFESLSDEEELQFDEACSNAIGKPLIPLPRW